MCVDFVPSAPLEIFSNIIVVTKNTALSKVTGYTVGIQGLIPRNTRVAPCPDQLVVDIRRSSQAVKLPTPSKC
jgi:hypothetical protein